MKTIIVFYKKAKYPFFLMIISLILAILNCGNKAFFLIFMFYSLLSMLLVFLKNKYGNSKIEIIKELHREKAIKILKERSE